MTITRVKEYDYTKRKTGGRCNSRFCERSRQGVRYFRGEYAECRKYSHGEGIVNQQIKKIYEKVVPY